MLVTCGFITVSVDVLAVDGGPGSDRVRCTSTHSCSVSLWGTCFPSMRRVFQYQHKILSMHAAIFLGGGGGGEIL